MNERAMLSCDEFLDLAAAVALDAHEPGQERVVEQHATDCPACARELDGFRHVAAAMGSGVPQVEPPATLRYRVVDLVRTTTAELPLETMANGLSSVATLSPRGSEVRSGAAAERPQDEARPGVLAEPRRATRPSARGPLVGGAAATTRIRRVRFSSAWLVAAASFVSLGALAWVAVLQSQIVGLQNDAQVAREHAARYDHVVELLASDKLAIRPLRPMATDMPSSGMVYMDPSSGTGMLMCHDLPPIEQGHVYQLWFMRGNERVSGGLLWPDRSGNGYTLIQVPSDLQSFEAVGLTDEPGSGSAWPTTPRVMGTPLKETSQ